MPKTRLMIITDGPFSGTGMSRQMYNVGFRLAQTNEFEISWLGISHFGHPIHIEDRMFPDVPHTGAKIQLLGNHPPLELFGASVFEKHYERVVPDAVLMMGDPHHIKPYISSKLRLHFPFYYYITLDGLPMNPNWFEFEVARGKIINPMKWVNMLIAFTEWAQIEYMKVGLNPAYIHHGLNWDWWKVSKQTKLKLRRYYGIADDIVLFSNWDVPQHRKRTDALLRCWRDFHPESKKAKLLLYADWHMETSLGWDIDALCKQYNVPRQTIISPEDLYGRPKYWQCPEPVEFVKSIVQMADVYASTTSGEGWGMCLNEAQAMGMPVIVTDYSAIPEVCEKGSILVPPYDGRQGRFRWHDRVRSVEGAIVNEEKFTEAFLRLYQDNRERGELGLQAREWTKQFDYDRKIVPAWVELLNTVNPDTLFAKEVLRA